MQAALDCYPCFLRQALQSARFAGADDAGQRRIVNLAMELLRNTPEGQSPLVAAVAIQAMIRRETGNPDPYRKAKETGNAEALRLLPALRETLHADADPLGLVLKAAVAGNVMDYGAFARFEVSDLIDQLHRHEFAVDDRADLEARLANARSLGYFADNAGEIVFDRLLIEEITARFPVERVRLVVRSEPFLNDVCEAEARAVGIDEIPEVEFLSLPVSPLDVDPALLAEATGSDVIIAKGMANFETYNERGDFHFLFIAKCDLVAGILSEATGRTISTGDWILLRPARLRDDHEIPEKSR